MKQSDLIWVFSLSAGFSAGVLTLLPSPAAASVYATSTNSTRIALYEDPSHPIYQQVGHPTGEYFTQLQGQTWTGQIDITHSEGTAGTYYYTGTFRDRLSNPNLRRTCTGNITIARSQTGRADQMGVRVIWEVTGGDSCPSVGQTFRLSLKEPFPNPNTSGNFTPQNSNAWNGGTQDSTWGAWRVSDSVGGLNCRNTPNGSVKKAYRPNERFQVQVDRSGSAFADIDGGSSWNLNGVPWLHTTDACYVRANSQYIQPASMPF